VELKIIGSITHKKVVVEFLVPKILENAVVKLGVLNAPETVNT
jgi:hypothetical protein